MRKTLAPLRGGGADGRIHGPGYGYADGGSGGLDELTILLRLLLLFLLLLIAMTTGLITTIFTQLRGGGVVSVLPEVRGRKRARQDW